MLRFGAGVLALLAICAAPVIGETLSDYARVKFAPCQQQCTRATLGLNLSGLTLPKRGIAIVSDGFMASSARWEIVDLESATATIVHIRRNSPDPKSGYSQNVARTTLSKEQLSNAIRIANKIWRRRWNGPHTQTSLKLPPMCTDVINEFILLDGERTLETFGTCPFSENAKAGWNIEEAKFDSWLNALFPQAPMPPQTLN